MKYCVSIYSTIEYNTIYLLFYFNFSSVCMAVVRTLGLVWLVSWREDLVIPFHKLNKSGHHPQDYQPIALTSC